jgi:Icc-related predicted phosphoesterase
MRFIYATDLHGDSKKYKDILEFAMENKIKLLHIGADLLPKGSGLFEIQKKFIDGYLKEFYEECHLNKIDVLAFFGNDDIYSLKKNFRKYGKLLDEEAQTIEEYIFTAYPYVCDYPFSLKTACKLDYRGWQRPFVFRAVDVNEKDFIDINDIDNYFENKSTIEEDLKNEVVLSQNVVMSMHMPPATVGLDVCFRGAKVGSQSIHNWILKEQPLLVLCGHIHESYDVTGIWKINIKNTVVIQPGQMKKTRFVVIDLEHNNVKTQLVEI